MTVPQNSTPLSREVSQIEDVLADYRGGKMVILVDDENRENEGDLVMPAEMVTPEAVNFVVTHARGLLCMPIIGERLDELQMPLMVTANGTEKNQTAFTVSIDYNVGTTTGISAGDRAATILAVSYTHLTLPTSDLV